jgi:hypothetical protein
MSPPCVVQFWPACDSYQVAPPVHWVSPVPSCQDRVTRCASMVIAVLAPYCRHSDMVALVIVALGGMSRRSKEMMSRHLVLVEVPTQAEVSAP